MKQNKFTKKKPVVDIEVSDIPQNTKATVKRLLKRLSNQKGKLILVLLTALLSSAAYALMPLMVGAGIDNLLKALRAYKKGSDILFLVSDALLVPVLMIGAAALATWILSYIQQYIIASVGEKFTLSLRQDISAKITKLPLRYFDSHKTGDIMSRITNDLEKVSEVLQVGLMQFISSVFTILITAVAMLLLSPGLSLLVLVSVAASTVATKFVSDLSQRYFAQNQAAVGELNGKVEELYTSLRLTGKPSLQILPFIRQSVLLISWDSWLPPWWVDIWFCRDRFPWESFRHSCNMKTKFQNLSLRHLMSLLLFRQQLQVQNVCLPFWMKRKNRQMQLMAIYLHPMAM